MSPRIAKLAAPVLLMLLQLGHVAATSHQPDKFNAFDTDTPAGATSGVIKTKVAGLPFTVDIIAVNAAGNQMNGFNGDVRVELVNGSSGSTCSTLSVIQQLPTQSFTSSSNGRITVSGINQPNSWRNVRIRIGHPAHSPSRVSCSSDSFAIRPHTFAITVSDTDWQTAGTARPLHNTGIGGGTVHKAGRPFTITAVARNGAGQTTTNYDGTLVASIAQCSATGGVCPGTLGTLTVGSWSGSAGTLVNNDGRYSDVGAFNLTLQDRTYADIDATDSTTVARYITGTVATGRFVPDHFTLGSGLLTHRTDLPSCSGSTFTYLGEPFSVAFGVTAKNAHGGITSAYEGALAKLVPGDASHLRLAAADATPAAYLTASISGITSANPGRVTTAAPHGFINGSQVYISGVAGMPGINNKLYSITVVDATSFTIGIDTSAYSAYLSGGTASRLSVVASSGTWTAGSVAVTSTVMLQRAATPDGPFVSATLGAAPMDPDGVSLLASSFDFDADKDGSMERSRLTAGEFRFGRLAVGNAHGSELLNLPVPLRAQFWNGYAFATNPEDNCTSLAESSINLTNHRSGLDSSNMNAANIQMGGQFAMGRSQLILTRPFPRPDQKGSVEVSIDLQAEDKIYLQGKWGGPGFSQNPRGLATFGIYKKGSLIHMREMY